MSKNPLREIKKRKIEGIYGNVGSFLEKSSKEAGYSGWGRLKEVSTSKQKQLFSLYKKTLKEKAKFYASLTAQKASSTSKKGVPWMLKIFIASLLVFQAFYPKTISHIFWTLLIILIILIIAIVIINVYTSGALNFLAGNVLNSITVSVLSIFLIVLLMKMYPSPNYSKWISTNWGELASDLSFLLILASMIFLIPNSPLGFIIGLVIFWMTLNVAGPIILKALSSAGGFCIPLESQKTSPILRNIFRSVYCKQNLKPETLIYEGKVIKIPNKGGISVTFGENGEMIPLMAGHNYTSTFFIINNYKNNISVKDIHSFIYTSYLGGLYFRPSYKINFKPTELLPGERLPFVIHFDAKRLSASAVRKCIWPNKIILKNSKFSGLNPNNPYCAYHSKTSYEYHNCPNHEGYKKTCVAIGSWLCNCTDYLDATCSGYPIKIGLEIKHTGVFIGKATLSYSEQNFNQESYISQITQGPVSMTFYFWPNPYVRKYYSQNIKTVKLFAKFHIGDEKYFRIDDINVEPITTTVSTIDLEHGLEFNETIGINKIDCSGLRKLKDDVNKGLRDWSGVICTFKAPEVNITIENMKNGEIINQTGINLDEIGEYCSTKTGLREQIFGKKKSKWISNTGLCSVLNTTTIKHALEYAQVIFRMNYTIEHIFYSPDISVYWSPLCNK